MCCVPLDKPRSKLPHSYLDSVRPPRPAVQTPAPNLELSILPRHGVGTSNAYATPPVHHPYSVRTGPLTWSSRRSRPPHGSVSERQRCADPHPQATGREASPYRNERRLPSGIRATETAGDIPRRHAPKAATSTRAQSPSRVLRPPSGCPRAGCREPAIAMYVTFYLCDVA
ncbi:hypothetical protein DFH07DRAFT_861492 [Mycena maculata]|uniref:Uncharacterized protein n=1 Tax=Mycena maculata TaxID=230809 RepID=A0AAD7HC09_9AGAR|nr:hypothetical protein DFH07DRAFT_861492 [Mycena maculata]